MSFKEKIVVLSLLFAIGVSFLSWLVFLFLGFTTAVPKKGGIYTEGIIGQPMYLNPLLSRASEADGDLTGLIYGGLLKYDGQGNLVKDLAENYEISEDGKAYTFNLRKDAKWHDGEPLTASDVYFTVNAVQDPAYRSPLRLNWQGVEMEQKDDYTIIFNLNSSYSGFPNNLTLGILPKHVWENAEPEKFTLSEYNLKPIGSGPYQFLDLQKDSGTDFISCNLRAFPSYYGGEPYISKLNFNFYLDYDSLLSAYNKKEIDGMGSILPDRIPEVKSAKSTNIIELNQPRYFAVFFNTSKSIPLASQKVREALAYATNRSEIIEKVLHGKGEAIFLPFLPQMKEYESDIAKYDFDLEKSKSILDEEGWKLQEDENVREKKDAKLEFEILTLDSPELAQTADILRDQWSQVGAAVKVSVLSISDLQQNYIKSREYSALLFGQETSFNPDPYSFWHSSQKRDPGLNIAMFDDKNADGLLDSARQERDEGKRIEGLKNLQKIITAKIPAVFLYSPKYVYPVNKKVKGIETQNINSPSGRFVDVNKWYVKMKRIWK